MFVWIQQILFVIQHNTWGNLIQNYISNCYYTAIPGSHWDNFNSQINRGKERQLGTQCFELWTRTTSIPLFIPPKAGKIRKFTNTVFYMKFGKFRRFYPIETQCFSITGRLLLVISCSRLLLVISCSHTDNIQFAFHKLPLPMAILYCLECRKLQCHFFQRYTWQLILMQ